MGEEAACKFLKEKKYKILDTNFFMRGAAGPALGEVDIIAKYKDIICFIEVKSGLKNDRTNKISPEQRVNYSKQKKLIKTGELWLAKNKFPLNTKWRIDIITVGLDPASQETKIIHFEDAISSN